MKIYLLWEPFADDSRPHMVLPPQLRGVWTDWQALRRFVRDRQWNVPPGGLVPYVDIWERSEHLAGQLVCTGSIATKVAQTVALDSADASGESEEEEISAQ